MKATARCLAILSLVLTGSCSPVLSREPVGSRVHVVDEGDWNGTWVMGNGRTATIRVLDSKAGLLELGLVGEEGNHLVSRVFEVQLLEHKEWVFGNIRDPDHAEAYGWALVSQSDEQLIIWVPSRECFDRLVEQGTLAGTRDSDECLVVHGLLSQHLESLSQEDAWEMFPWTEPFAMIRIARFND